MFLRDKNYTECTVEFKIKGDKFVNDTKYYRNCLIFNVDYLLRADRLQWIIIHFIIYTPIKQLNTKNKNM